MAKKLTGKIKSDDGGYIAPPGATNQNRVLGRTQDVNLLNQWNRASNAQQVEAFARAMSGDSNFQASLQQPARGDALSGRTVESGTRSILEGLRSFMSGGLRKGAK